MGYLLIKDLTKDKIQITGDTRFNRVQERKDSHAMRKEFDAFRSSKNVILGSVIPSDYHVVFGGLKKIFPSGQGDLEQENVRLIVVPHEPVESEISEIIRILDDWKIGWSKLSEFGEDETPSALIVDEVGLLADIYSIGRCAYVGAGFGAGVHSVIEPAVHGCPVSFGPNIHILDEAIDLHELGLGTIVTSEQGFSPLQI